MQVRDDVVGYGGSSSPWMAAWHLGVTESRLQPFELHAPDDEVEQLFWAEASSVARRRSRFRPDRLLVSGLRALRKRKGQGDD
jgi:hypothetical protein